MVGETYVGLVAILAPFISIVLHNLHLAPGLALKKNPFQRILRNGRLGWLHKEKTPGPKLSRTVISMNI